MDTNLTKADLRDYIIRAHGMSDGSYLHPPDEMLRRINNMLGKAIMGDSVMKSFLGYSDDHSHNMFGGSGTLDD